MANGLERCFYFWREGRLKEVNASSHSKFGKWNESIDDPDLVFAVEKTNDGPIYAVGPAATIPLVTLALIRNTRPGLRVSENDLGPDLPETLIEQVAAAATAATDRIVQKFSQLGIEERQTGVLIDHLEASSTTSPDGWQAHVFVQDFSPQIKEPIIGADIGILIDVRHGSSVTL